MGPLKNAKKRKLQERDLEKQIESVELTRTFFNLSVSPSPKRARVVTFTDPGPSIGTVWIAPTPEQDPAEEDDVLMADDNNKGKGKEMEDDSDISESDEGVQETVGSDIMDYSDSYI